MMKRILLFLALLLPVALSAEDLRVAHIFSDHMVLQRESKVPVWGWGDPGKTVTVTPSWYGAAPVTAKVAKDGSWRVNVDTGEAGGPYVLTVKSGKESIHFVDVLLGEVWICAGQSNMEMPISGFGFQEVAGARDAIIKAATFADLRRYVRGRLVLCHGPCRQSGRSRGHHRQSLGRQPDRALDDQRGHQCGRHHR